MRYVVGLIFTLALGVMGCSETVGTDGRWDNWFWDGYDCPGCQCEPTAFESNYTTLDCFCCRYHCEPGLGPFGNGSIQSQTIIEYDCDRRYIRELTENPEIEFLVDTTTSEVVAASYGDDCCVCGFDDLLLRAGDWGLEGCEKLSEQTCPGPCDAGAVQP